MPDLKLVQVMKEDPACCLLCGSAPTDETKETPVPLPAIHAVGLDVNWGDSVYVCMICAGIICDLIDRPSEEKVKKAAGQAVFQKKRADKADQRVEELEKQLAAIVAGDKARAAVRKATS